MHSIIIHKLVLASRCHPSSVQILAQDVTVVRLASMYSFVCSRREGCTALVHSVPSVCIAFHACGKIHMLCMDPKCTLTYSEASTKVMNHLQLATLSDFLQGHGGRHLWSRKLFLRLSTLSPQCCVHGPVSNHPQTNIGPPWHRTQARFRVKRHSSVTWTGDQICFGVNANVPWLYRSEK
jgi:hypothetical protein